MFYCSADGNPKPKVFWSKINGTRSANTYIQHNKLEIRNATYDDSGKYVCKATSLLGNVQRVAELFVEGEMLKCKTPLLQITAPFNNMWNLKFKSQPTVALFPAVNHN